MEIAIVADVPFEERKDPTREGLIKRKWLLTGEAADGLSFRLFRSQYQQGDMAFQSPRHHHGFQQIRWAEAGAINYGPGLYIPEGDIAYFPRGTYYGPQVKDEGVCWLLQFGFGAELLGGKQALALHREAVERLKERGRIEDGVFIDVDPETGEERRRNPAEVIAQEATGTAYRIPPEAYAEPILMHVEAFDYHWDAEGVEMKPLGRFFDHPGHQGDLGLAMLRIGKGSAHALPEDRAQIGWSLQPGLKIGDTVYPAHTSFYVPRGEAVVLGAEAPCEIQLITFPRLD